MKQKIHFIMSIFHASCVRYEIDTVICGFKFKIFESFRRYAYLSVRWLGVRPRPRLAGGGGGGSSSPSDLEPASGFSGSTAGGGGGNTRFALVSVSPAKTLLITNEMCVSWDDHYQRWQVTHIYRYILIEVSLWFVKRTLPHLLLWIFNLNECEIWKCYDINHIRNLSNLMIYMQY